MSEKVQVSVGVDGIGKIRIWIDEGKIGISVCSAIDEAS